MLMRGFRESYVRFESGLGVLLASFLTTAPRACSDEILENNLVGATYSGCQSHIQAYHCPCPNFQEEHKYHPS